MPCKVECHFILWFVVYFRHSTGARERSPTPPPCPPASLPGHRPKRTRQTKAAKAAKENLR